MATSQEQTTELTDLLVSILSSKDMNLSTKRCEEIQEKGARILNALLKRATDVSAYMGKVGAIFKTIFEKASKTSSTSERLVKCWSQFHSLRLSILPDLWRELLKTCNLDPIRDNDSLILQTLMQQMFQSEMKTVIATAPPESTTTSQHIPEITTDEKNIIMYASGYVPVSLIRRYKKSKNPRAANFVQCLLNMAVGAYEEEFYDYARYWYELHNRGGAFEVNDATFSFFLQLEKLVRTELFTLSPHTQSSTKNDIIEKIRVNESINFHWSMLAVELTDDESTELLVEIIKLWISMRGHSIAGVWLEQYKQIAGTHSKQKAGLRKELKKGSKVVREQ